MTGLGLALLLAAAPDPLTLSLPPFEAQGLPEGEATYWSAVLANGLRRQGIRVVPADGADGTLQGQLSRVAAAGWQMDLRVVAPDGQVLARFSMTAQSQSEANEVMQRASQELSAELFGRLQRLPVPQKQEPAPAPPEPPATSKIRPGVVLGIVIAVLGAGGLAGGGALIVTARSSLGAVAQGRPGSYFLAQQQANEAKNLSTVGGVLAITGGVLFAGGLLYALYSGKVNTFFTVSGLLAPDGGGLVLSGVLP